MWNKPWGMKEGFAIGLALIVIGLVLQFSIGGICCGSCCSLFLEE